MVSVDRSSMLKGSLGRRFRLKVWWNVFNTSMVRGKQLSVGKTGGELVQKAFNVERIVMGVEGLGDQVRG